MSNSRQLAAIMFTDIIGYTALMGKDFQKALELVRISKEIQKPLVEKHEGQWIKEIGDGALATFGTALDAVNCAIEIQRVSRADFDGDLRIGIHLGDITIEQGDVYGDGVNIASRLESICDPGGIYISDAIEKAIRGQSNIQAKYLGESRLKNVDYGVRTYALQGVGLPIPDNQNSNHISGKLIAELVSRGVLRVAVTYILFSLLLILLYPYVASFFSLDEGLITPFRVALMVAFPIAIYLAWYYELSPKGLVRTHSLESWQNPYGTSKSKPLTSNFSIVLLVVIITVLYSYPHFFQKQSPLNMSSQVAVIKDKSIAVMPFDNLSNDPQQDYISDGMMEAILNHLNKIEGLRLTSRTTMMGYKNKDKSVPEIASEVAVKYVLEGSVMRVDNTIRINAQLIDGQSDEHIWSEVYEGKLSDLLNIQSDVAMKIAGELKLNLDPRTRSRIEHLPTRNTEAYDLYLSAKSSESFEDQVTLLEKAITLDPLFSEAYTELGMVWGYNFTDWKKMNKGLAILNKSLELEPNQTRPHEILANISLWAKWDFYTAIREQNYAQLKDPTGEHRSWELLCVMGNYKEGLDVTKAGITREPNNPHLLIEHAILLYFNNRPEEAYKYMLKANDPAIKGNIDEGWSYYGHSGRAYFFLGKYKEAISIIEYGINNGAEYGPRHLGILAMSYYALGNIEKSNEYLNQIDKVGYHSHSIYKAMIYTQRGDYEKAFALLEKAYKDRENDMWLINIEPPFKPLRSDPRWQEMLDKVGFPDSSMSYN